MIPTWVANNRQANAPQPPVDPWKAGIFVAGNTVFGWGYGKPPIIGSEMGTLVEEPYADGELVAFFEGPSDEQVIVCITGDIVDQLDGHTFSINGTTLSVLTPASYVPENDWTLMFLEPHWMIDGEAYVIARVPLP